MPLRILASTRTSGLRFASAEPYVCRACLHKAVRRQFSKPATSRTTNSAKVQGLQSVKRSTLSPSKAYKKHPAKRYAHHTSLASATAINAPTSVPHAYRALHQQLIALQDSASSYVDLARLQLAARSLEGEPVVTRVAFLGLGKDGQRAARKLARVLLADALVDEEAWETEIMDGVYDGRSLLLRYGDAEDAVGNDPLVKTMNIPSPYLRRHGVEILVSGLNAGNAASSDRETVATLKDAILVPSLTTPNAAGGRVGFVRYPVHKAVLVAEGIAGAVQYGRLPATLVDGTLISTALSVPLRPASGAVSAEGQASTDSVDIDLAAHALDIFRESKANGAQFSREWQTSRISEVGAWAAGNTNSETTSPGLSPAVANMISSLLSDASTSISLAETSHDTTATATTIPESKRQYLQTTITSWSAESHHDLQTNLDIAFSDSPAWRRTTWWRLFWRIDDVTISASDILYRSWLTESEQLLAFVSGCIAEAGLATREQLRSSTPRLLGESQGAVLARHEELKDQRKETVAELIQLPSMLARMQEQSGVNPQFAPPWPQTISLSRQYMFHTLVPDLHRKAQALLLTAASTIGGSAALGGWFWLATGGVGLYESGAIFALGLVWSLRRLQTKWSHERDGFAVAVREDARRVLGEVETHLRKLVNEGGRVTVESADSRSWNEARGAVYRCQRALESIAKSAPSS